MIRNRLGVALRDMRESLGDKGLLETIKEMLKDGELSPLDWSIQEAWHAFERDANGNVRDYYETVSSDLFPQITGELINTAVRQAYDMPGLIGDQLCRTLPGRLKTDTYVSIDALDGPDEVLEGQPYNDRSMGEGYTTVTHIKKGNIISVTEETVLFDQTGQILDRARRIGEKAALDREKRIVQGVQDVNSNVYKPSGVAEALYSSSRTRNGIACYNLKATNAFGEAGLKEIRKLMHNMVDENGDPVMINPNGAILLYPNDLEVQVLQMLRSAKVPEGSENAENIYAGTFKPLSSFYVTDQSSTTWYIGNFAQDFVWSEIWPLQTFSARPGNLDEFRKDIKSQHKVRYFGEIMAQDFAHSFKCTA